MRLAFLLVPLIPLAVGLPAQSNTLNNLQQLLSTKSCAHCDLRRVDLVLANLEDADLVGANLEGANLSQANLTGANLEGANLKGATLVGSNLAGANLAKANAQGADFRNAYLVGTILASTNLEYVNLQGALGVPPTAGRFEDFHNWGVASARAGRHEQALKYYNQALQRNPKSAITYLSRAISRQNLSDTPGAITDSQRAKQLFEDQGNTQGKTSAEQLTIALQDSLKPAKKGFLSGLQNSVQSILPLLLQFL
jgi:uncharacterized protein YjbI with pentapeptide repeats